MSNIEVREIAFDSPEQKESINLRYKVLRAPLGLTYNPEDLAKEYLDFHIALYLEGALAGILLLKPTDVKGIIKMRQVAVDTELQGTGLGKQMVAFSEQFCRDKGFNTIELHARETAVPFYLSMQYQLTGEPFKEVGIPHRKMFKNL